MGEFVSMPVREEHVPRVYALLAELERGEDELQPPAEVPAAEPPLDEALVTRMYRESEDRHRKLLRVLAANPGQWLYTADLMKALGVDRKGMAGVFGAFGRRSKYRYGGVTPWERDWRSNRGENGYRMSPEVAGFVSHIASEI